MRHARPCAGHPGLAFLNARNAQSGDITDTGSGGIADTFFAGQIGGLPQQPGRWSRLRGRSHFCFALRREMIELDRVWDRYLSVPATGAAHRLATQNSRLSTRLSSKHVTSGT